MSAVFEVVGIRCTAPLFDDMAGVVEQDSVAAIVTWRALGYCWWRASG